MKFDQTLLNFSAEENSFSDVWTLEDAFKGVQIFGGIGSGKTSGSGRTLATAFLSNGFGGLVLCAKPTEREDWENLAKQTGRTKDLKIFCEPKLDGSGNIISPEYFFNPLDYEASREGGGETFNLVNLFMQIYQMGRVISGEGLSSGGERFWDNALKRCLSRMIDFLRLADEPVTVANMYRLISEALNKKEIEFLNELRENNDEDSFEKISEWAKFNFYVHCLVRVMNSYSKLKKENGTDKGLIESKRKQIQIVKNYFEREFANLAEKTKTIIVESFLGLAEPFQTGILEKYFSGKTNITPEETFEQGKIIILDFPIKNYLEAGVYAQGLFKLLWQQAVERRKYKEDNIPVFLWVDESHNFLTSYDQIFQTTARSAGVSTVFLSQNISNYYVAIGGNNSTARVNSLLGNLSTKIFHANNDYVTNEWAANTIGKTWVKPKSFTVGESQSFGMSEQFNWELLPNFFTTLKNGGRKNHGYVEAVIVTSRNWSNGKNFLIRSFQQSKR